MINAGWLKLFSFVSSFFALTILVFPKSFSIYKLALLCVILIVVLLGFLVGRFRLKSMDPVYFYLIFSLLAMSWILVGTVKDGYDQAIYDAIRLYIVFSFIFCVFVACLQNIKYEEWLMNVLTYSGIFISVFNILLFAGAVYGVDFFPESLKVEMQLRVGLHEGHSQMASNNINSLFFILPALIGCWLLEGDFANNNKKKIVFSIILCLIAVFLSGRRALIFLLPVVPAIVFLQYFYAKGGANLKDFKRLSKIFVFLCLVPALMILMFYLSGNIDLSELYVRITSAFSESGPRATQFYSLFDGFVRNPVLGSGVGGSVDLVRSADRPWMYELSYMMLLFNGGIVGFGLVMSFMAFYYLKALKSVKNGKFYMSEKIALLTGLLVFSAGNATNPYFSGFDALFLLGLLPLIAGDKNEQDILERTCRYRSLNG
jgi:hypothetical protein